MNAKEKGSARGPRGGKTTRREGAVRKNFWLDKPIADALRREAFERETSETEVIAEALAVFLGVDSEK